MKVLVVGGGGREHTLVWKLKQSPRVESIYCAPGNGGISAICQCVNIHAEDIGGLVDFAASKNIDLVVVGPEVPLVMGIADQLEKKGIRCFGPRKSAAELEGSKVFSKYLMKKYNIPTADYREFEDSQSAKAYLKDSLYPVVIKADGLASGKGVIIAKDYLEACSAVREIMEDKVFKSAGDRIIVEEYLEGPEVSVLAFTDGKTVKPMVSSRDHKRIYDKDLGPNTGGMGAISPASGYTEKMASYCMENIFIPTIRAMEMEGRAFKGVLYFGLILNNSGPKVLEYNCRFGDPETQAVLPRLKTDLVDIIDAVIDGNLETLNIQWDDRASCCIVMASGGYPGRYEAGKKISGLDDLPKDIMAFHSGTKKVENDFVTHGGRVLGVASLGTTASEAASNVYNVIDRVNFEGAHYRKDIGQK